MHSRCSQSVDRWAALTTAIVATSCCRRMPTAPQNRYVLRNSLPVQVPSFERTCRHPSISVLASLVGSESFFSDTVTAVAAGRLTLPWAFSWLRYEIVQWWRDGGRVATQWQLLTLARTWGGADATPSQVGFVPCTPCF